MTTEGNAEQKAQPPANIDGFCECSMVTICADDSTGLSQDTRRCIDYFTLLNTAFSDEHE
jgi:hypothetical protein